MSELYHHGIKGMRWGVRRFQNADGSLTASGRTRYNTSKGYHGALDNDGSVSGRIRNKQYAEANRRLSESKKALRELKSIEAHVSKSGSRFAQSKFATSIRNKQIAKEKRIIADSEASISELKEISKAKGFIGGYTSVNVSQIMGDTGIHDRKR